MLHFLVLLHDGTDAAAPARRQAARDAHLGQLKEKVASGKVVFGGRISRCGWHGCFGSERASGAGVRRFG